MIYFVKANDRVKIGYAEDPSSRIPSIQTSSPYKLEVLLIIDGSIEVERELHKRFQKYRITGEWFKYDDRLEAFVVKNMDKDRKFEFGFIVGDFSEFEQVLRLRKRHSITLSELGEKLNITAQSVKEIQDREKMGTVSINVLRNVAEALGYRFEYRFVPINEE
jgi:hypothetical protein